MFRLHLQAYCLGRDASTKKGRALGTLSLGINVRGRNQCIPFIILGIDPGTIEITAARS